MKKIPTVFDRDWDSRTKHVIDKVNSEAAWLFGPGARFIAQRKVDGTCVMFDGTNWWARREVKVGKEMPAGYQAIDVDPETQKIMGYEPISQSSFYKFFLQALYDTTDYTEGTYELCGPKINGNPENLNIHTLFNHNKELEWLSGMEDKMTYDALKDVCSKVHNEHGWEGLVFKEIESVGENTIFESMIFGRMAKLKFRDFPRD